MVLPRIANPFRAFLGRCRFESGLFRHRGPPDTSIFFMRICLSDSRKDGRRGLVPAAARQYDRLAQMARAVVSRVRVPDRLARESVPDLPPVQFPEYQEEP